MLVKKFLLTIRQCNNDNNKNPFTLLTYSAVRLPLFDCFRLSQVGPLQTALTMGAILESGYANLRHNPGQNSGVPALMHCEIERVKVWGLESKWIAVSRETHPRCGQQAHHVIEVNACKRIGCLVVAIAFNNNSLPYRYTNTSCAFSLYSQRQHSPASPHSRSLAVMVRFIIVCEPTRTSDVTPRSHFKRFIMFRASVV